jgi:tetratricopeptide (TPR) repeat protein
MNLKKKLFNYHFHILLFFLIFVSYSPSIQSPYFLDDAHTITTNFAIHTYDNFFSLWTSPRYFSSLPSNSTYRPVVTMSNLILWNIDHGKTWPFHVWKMFLFFLLTIILFRIWKELFQQVDDKVLKVAVLIFAVNPVHTQVVIYISALATLYAGLFIALTLLFYLQYRKTQKITSLFISIFFVFLAILSKEIGFIGLPLVLLTEALLSLDLQQKGLGKRLFSLFFIYLVPITLGVTLLLLNYEPKAAVARGDTSSWNYFMTQWRAYIRYFFMYIAAYELNMDNLQFGFSNRLSDLKVITSLIINICFIFLSFFWISGRHYKLAFGIIWFYLSIFPSSSFWVLAEPVNDHRAFIGYFGLTFLVIELINYLYKRNRRLFWSFCTILILSYSTSTFIRAKQWSSHLLLLTDNVKKNPGSGRAYNNLAVKLMTMAQFENALQNLNKCIVLYPNYSTCYVNKALVKATLGQEAAARENFLKAIEFDFGVIVSRQYFADFLKTRGYISEPIELLEKANEYASGLNLPIRINLVQLYVKAGEVQKAKELWRSGLVHFASNSQYKLLGSTFAF